LLDIKAVDVDAHCDKAASSWHQRVPDFAFESGPKVAQIDPFDPEMEAVA
jgi:hypothetical protein